MTIERATSRLADMHCHIDLYPVPREVVAEVEARGVFTLAVTNLPSLFVATQKLISGCRYLRAAVGLHPELVVSHERELEQFWPHLEQTRFVGEIGLDYTTQDASERLRQRVVFSRIVERCATLGNRILTVHSRRAATDVLDVFGPDYPGKVILHWFSGGQRELARAVERGFFFSINPQMAVAKNGQALIAKIPHDRVLFETDGPFVKLGSSAARPPDTFLVAQRLAQLWEMPVSDVESVVFKNFLNLIQ